MGNVEAVVGEVADVGLRWVRELMSSLVGMPAFKARIPEGSS